MRETTRAAGLVLLLLALLAARIPAAEPPASPRSEVPADSPIDADRLALETEQGELVPFADLLGTDGRAVCFAFLHPNCPLAQE